MGGGPRQQKEIQFMSLCMQLHAHCSTIWTWEWIRKKGFKWHKYSYVPPIVQLKTYSYMHCNTLRMCFQIYNQYNWPTELRFTKVHRNNLRGNYKLESWRLGNLVFKRRFFIGLLSSVRYLSTISTIIFYVLQDNCGLNACKRRLLSYSLGW